MGSNPMSNGSFKVRGYACNTLIIPTKLVMVPEINET